MHVVGSVIELVLWLFILVLIARFIMDWVQMFARSWTPRGPALVLLEIVYSVTDPPIKAVRRILPPIRIGGMGLDLSPM
ncbi:MAG: YggT family protein, partial [Marmoricola sp.]